MDSPCNHHKCMGYYGIKSLECQMIVRSYCAKYNDVSSIEAGDDGCASFVRDDKDSISTTTKTTQPTTLSQRTTTLSPRTTRSTTRKSHTSTIPGIPKTTTFEGKETTTSTRSSSSTTTRKSHTSTIPGLLKPTTSISSTTKNQYVTTSKDPEYCPFKKDSMDSPCNHHKCMGYYGTKSLECQMIVRSYCAKYNDVSASFVRDDKGSISTTTKRTRTTTLSPPRTTRSSSSSSTTTRKSHTSTIPGLLKTTTSISSTKI